MNHFRIEMKMLAKQGMKELALKNLGKRLSHLVHMSYFKRTDSQNKKDPILGIPSEVVQLWHRIQMI